MDKRELEMLLDAVASGQMPPQEATNKLRIQPYSDLGFAKVDHHRGIRQGVSEVIYGEGKTAAQMAAIINNMSENGQERILVTRLSPEAAHDLIQGRGHVAALTAVRLVDNDAEAFRLEVMSDGLENIREFADGGDNDRLPASEGGFQRVGVIRPGDQAFVVAEGADIVADLCVEVAAVGDDKDAGKAWCEAIRRLQLAELEGEPGD